MKHFIHYSTTILHRVQPFIPYLFALFFFIINATYVMYPDEFINMLGGKAILQGKVPYKDYFDHHMPFAWYLSAILLIPSMGNYILFRILWALFSFILLLLVGIHIYRTNKSLHLYYSLFVFLYPLVAMYYWTHLFLADSLGFLFIGITLWILLIETFATKHPRHYAIIVASISTCFLIFSSMTYVMVGSVFYVWQLYLMYISKKKLKDVFKLIGIIFAPYLFFTFYLLVTNSWREFYVSNVVYNTKLYISIPNYTKGNFFNPFKFIFTLIYNFYQQYLPLLSTIKHLDLYNSMAALFAFSTFLLMLFLFWKNKLVFIFFFFILSFSAPRSQFQVINETDYQAAGFIILGFVAIFFLLWVRTHVIVKDRAIELGVAVSTLVVMIMTLSMGFFMAKYSYERWFLRYTQVMPSIQSTSETAKFIDGLLPKNSYYWVGPYEPQHQFFVKNATLPGAYISLLPQFKEDDYFRNKFLNQLEKSKPTIIIFRHLASIFNTPADTFGDFLLEWMKGKYVRPADLKLQINGSPSTFNLREDLYIRKEKLPVVRKRLKELGYLD